MRRRHRDSLSGGAQIGIAWYSREAWERLRETAADRDQLDDSFEEWERGALQAIHDLASDGQQVCKVPIDIDAYSLWCSERRCRLDSASRAEYVAERMKTLGTTNSSR